MISHRATFNESQIDGTWYTDVTTFARNTHLLNTSMVDDSSLGMTLFSVSFLTAAHRPPATASPAITPPSPRWPRHCS